MEHVEAVIMRGGQPRFGGLRSTLCISSQVGCKMGYKFCATGSLGFKNNLPLEEIVEQLVHASHLSQIRNVVFMSCTANIGKGYGDDWEGEFFPGIPKIKYESPSSKSPLAFKWYNAEEEILGKKMSVFPFSLLSLSPLSQLLLLFLLLRWCLLLGKILGFLLFNLLASHPYFILLSFNIYLFYSFHLIGIGNEEFQFPNSHQGFLARRVHCRRSIYFVQ